MIVVNWVLEISAFKKKQILQVYTIVCNKFYLYNLL